MKILVLHNSYQNQGGEDTVVDLETSHLAARGHEVRLERVSNNSIRGIGPKARTLMLAAGSRESGLRVRQWISEFSPDVVHVHNFFPLLTPAAHHAAAEAGIPVVQTLHNFRLLCAGALLLRDGAICEDCLGHAPWPALRHKCYRNSFPGTAAVVAMQLATRGSLKWLRAVDRFIALNTFGRDKFIEGGLPADRIAVKPNFVSAPEEPLSLVKRTRSAIFVGRLSPEKGALDLVRAWHDLPDLTLDIVGDGPDMERMREEAPANVRFHGKLSYEATQDYIRNARLLLFPSKWYETFGLTIIEAMAAGTPIVAARLGSAEALLQGRSFAKLYEPGNKVDMTNAIRRTMNDSCDEQILAARSEYLKFYTPISNMKQLEAIYESAVQARLGSTFAK